MNSLKLWAISLLIIFSTYCPTYAAGRCGNAITRLWNDDQALWHEVEQRKGTGGTGADFQYQKEKEAEDRQRGKELANLFFAADWTKILQAVLDQSRSSP